MQSNKKCKRPKKNTMSAQEFATPFANNIGSYAKAVIIADNYELNCRQASLKDDLSKEGAKEFARTANFYANVAGILRKAQVKMGAQPTPKRGQAGGKNVKEDTSDRRPTVS